MKTKTGSKRKPTSVSPRVQLLGSGTILREVLAAADILEREWGVAADVWSVTSFSELRRTALESERTNRHGNGGKLRLSWVERCLGPTQGPVIAATDYVRTVPDLIRAWVPRRYLALGTDGFGRSDTRSALRSFFEVDRTAIAFAALRALVDDGDLAPPVIADFIARHKYAPAVTPPWAEAGDGEIDSE